MPKSTKQNKSKRPGGRPPEGVRRVSARPMGATGAYDRSARMKGVK